MEECGDEFCKQEWLRTPEENGPLCELSRTHGGLQRLKHQSQSLHRSVVETLHMLWLLAWCLEGIPESESGHRSGSVSDCFVCSWDPFSPTRLTHSTLM